jgi:hypothetical protein
MDQITPRRLIKVSAIFLIAIVSCVLLYVGATTMLKAFLVDDTELDATAVKQLLKLAQAHPIGAIPQDDLDIAIQAALIPYYLKDDPKCWEAIQEAVVKNGDNFTISASDPFREFRDVDNSVVTVQFRDGQKISFVFYQRAVVGCSLKLPSAK